MAGVRHTRKTCGPWEAHRVYCPIELDGIAHLHSCLFRKASALVVFTEYLVGRFPWTLRISPQPSHHAHNPHTTRSRYCSDPKVCYTDYSSSRTWDRGGSSFVAVVCIHNAHQPLTAIKAWHLSSVGTTGTTLCSRNSGGPRCSSLAGQSAMYNIAHSGKRADVRVPGHLVQASQQKACKCIQAKLSLDRL